MPTTPRSLPPISAEYRQFVLDQAPRFAALVDRARNKGEEAKKSRQAKITLSVFRDNPFLLYAALWYAASAGVTITVTPPRPTAAEQVPTE